MCTCTSTEELERRLDGARPCINLCVGIPGGGGEHTDSGHPHKIGRVTLFDRDRRALTQCRTTLVCWDLNSKRALWSTTLDTPLTSAATTFGQQQEQQGKRKDVTRQALDQVLLGLSDGSMAQLTIT